MSRQSFAVGLVCAVIGLFATAGKASAQSPLFTWGTFKSTKDGNTYSHPIWTDVGGGKVKLDSAGGLITVTKNYKCTKGVMKIYRPSVQFPGTYEATAWLESTATPQAGTVTDNVLNQGIDWADPNTPAKQFTAGLPVKLEIYLTIEDAAGGNPQVIQLASQYPQPADR